MNIDLRHWDNMTLIDSEPSAHAYYTVRIVQRTSYDNRNVFVPFNATNYYLIH